MTKKDLDLLFDRCLDGVASPEEYEALKGVLCADSDARGQYVRMCQLRQALADKLVPHNEELIPQKTLPARRRPTRTLATVMALAASLVAAVIFWPDADPSRDGQGDSVASPDPAATEGVPEWSSPEAIARVDRKINCVWSDDSWSLARSSEIVAGQTIGLERGFMLLTFRNGVSVALEGPVEYTVINQLRGTLDFGGIGVRVPDGFKGYVVDTPTAKVTDLGTEFSVRVSQRGETDLRVIEGEVEVSWLEKKGERSRRSELLAKDAVWSSISGVRTPSGPPSPTDFPTATLLEDPLFEQTPDYPLSEKPMVWLSADSAVKTDSRGGVLAWGDISSTLREDRHSAWQVEPRRRPKLIKSGMRGEPCIRFDGEDDCLITEPFSTGNAQTIVVVSKINSFLPSDGDVPSFQLLNYNGPPHLVIEYRYQPKYLRAFAFAGFSERVVNSGNLRAWNIKKGKPFAVVYTYDHDADKATLFLDGKWQGRAKAKFPVASARPKVIGLHRRLQGGGLKGDIAELMIFDRAIAPAETRELFSYIESRYGKLNK